MVQERMFRHRYAIEVILFNTNSNEVKYVTNVILGIIMTLKMIKNSKAIFRVCRSMVVRLNVAANDTCLLLGEGQESF